MELYNKGFFVNGRGEIKQVFEQDYSFLDKENIPYRLDGECMLWGRNDFNLIKKAKEIRRSQND
jgi:hypothetical protein